jgi:CheY-specific phosphatase CheX
MDILAEKGKGTKFLFKLPYETMPEFSGLSATSILDPVIDTTQNYLLEKLKCNITVVNKDNSSNLKNLLLKDFTCFMLVKGIVNGRFVFSMERKLAELLLDHVMVGGSSGAEPEMYIEDLIGEISNIIIGNSIKRFQGMEDLIVIEPPVTIKISDATLKYINSPAWSCDIESEYGNMSISFIVPPYGSLIRD